MGPLFFRCFTSRLAISLLLILLAIPILVAGLVVFVGAVAIVIALRIVGIRFVQVLAILFNQALRIGHRRSLLQTTTISGIIGASLIAGLVRLLFQPSIGAGIWFGGAAGIGLLCGVIVGAAVLILGRKMTLNTGVFGAGLNGFRSSFFAPATTAGDGPGPSRPGRARRTAVRVIDNPELPGP